MITVSSFFMQLASAALVGAVAAIPAQPPAEELAGTWMLVDRSSGVICQIKLTSEGFNGNFAAIGNEKCLAGLGLPGVSAWRPASDGIGLAAPDGRTIGFFSRLGDDRLVLTYPARNTVNLLRR